MKKLSILTILILAISSSVFACDDRVSVERGKVEEIVISDDSSSSQPATETVRENQ